MIGQEALAMWWTKNTFYDECDRPEEISLFNKDQILSVLKLQQSHPAYEKTPLLSLEGLAKQLKLNHIMVKDEAYRFGLNAFKVMGGIYAMARCIAEKIGAEIDELTFDDLRSSEIQSTLGTLTFISATDGNHGRGVAWAARELGHKAIIYLPKGSSEERIRSIRQEGAAAEMTDMNYDDTVRMCASLAEKNGWMMIQDTAWEGYDKIPLWVMQGYASIAMEIVEDLARMQERQPTHVLLQAGVGSFAGAIAAYLVNVYQKAAPKIILVEPREADCFYRSFMHPDGERVTVKGDMNTIMAGLACGEPNDMAYRLLKPIVSASFSCTNPVAAAGMRIYGNPVKPDPQVISGESGAVTLGLLYYLKQNPRYSDISDALGLDENANVLLINTEGDTDQAHYREVVWKGKYPSAY